MAVAMKTPGVYIVEKDAFPNSVVAVATAVPAFIGYTERADNKGKSLANTAWRITSLAEFHDYYGGAPSSMFDLSSSAAPEVVAAPIEPDPDPTPPVDADDSADEDAVVESVAEVIPPEVTPDIPSISVADLASVAAFTFNGVSYTLAPEGAEYLLYNSMRLFFQNGGGPCYIVSIGTYADGIDAAKLMGGIEELLKEQEPTMVVIPDAVRLEVDNCILVQQAALTHCGAVMKNRFAILDVHDGYKGRKDTPDCIATFRNKLGVNNLDFAAAYYPWLNTSIVQDSELTYRNISESGKAMLQTLLREELAQTIGIAEIPDPMPATDPDPLPDYYERMKQQAAEISKITFTDAQWTGSGVEEADLIISKVQLHKSLLAISDQLYRTILKEIKDKLNLLPPSGAMAGVYTAVDIDRGVWKAPANVSLNAVISPSVNITNADQEDLNVTAQGKSINAIRPFVGEGVLVWGGRTLDGNSLDWRYIQVRRTMIFLEESIRLAAKAYVFENNVAGTWVTIKGMLNNFLTGIWKQGGLAGSSPGDAFGVFVGLGETMTPEDILEGILRVTVLVALVRPAEFIEITFQQKMQQS